MHGHANSRDPSYSVFYFAADGPSLLGLSHISNASMNVNETAMTTATMSRLETADPIDTFDATICPEDDLLDGCKVSFVLHNSPRIFVFYLFLSVNQIKHQFRIKLSVNEAFFYS